MCKKLYNESIKDFNFENTAMEIIKGYIKKNKSKKTKTKTAFINIKKSKFKNLYTCYEKCPDNYVGSINKKASKLFVKPEFRFNNNKKLLVIPQCRHKKMVILMESPHKDEFSRNLTAPALGQTGERIQKFLGKLLLKKSLMSYRRMDVFLVNAIQYQCSLGVSTHSGIRNTIFNGL